ncbi:hypothetical protein [Elioraea rosea]|uniref:hypothetical protein n=1 Tax=Elioraea rosea TaxID=2492390 RepID=UPI001181D1AE|nr:hypothetical protein [Elioraea rosea]
MYHPLPELGFTPGAGRSGPAQAVFAIYYDNVADRAFERAADTFLRRASFWFPGSVPLKYGATSVPELLLAWDRVAEEARGAGANVLCGGLFTHASPGGPYPGGLEGGIELAGIDRTNRMCPTDITLASGHIGRMTQLPWSPSSVLMLCGCNTAVAAEAGYQPVAQMFALRQGVRTIGQQGWSSFSARWHSYRRIAPADTEVCLWAYSRGRNAVLPFLGSELRVPGVVFR